MKHTGIHALSFALLLWCRSIVAAEVGNALDGMANQLLSQISLEGKHTMAVIPFEAKGSHGPDVGQSLAEYLVAVVQNHPSFELVDRTQFSNVMKELALSQTGAIDEKKALEAGKALAAQYLLLGTVSDALGKTMISARVVETESARIVATANLSLDPGALKGFSKELLGETGNVTASLFRSMLVPGWGQFYAHQRLRGGISLAAFLASGAIGGVAIAKTVRRGSHYEDFVDSMKLQSAQDEFRLTVCPTGCTQSEFNALKSAHSDSLYDVYLDQKRKAIIFGAVTAGVWALNLVDASIAGAQSRKKLKLYFGARNLSEYEAGMVYAF